MGAEQTSKPKQDRTSDGGKVEAALLEGCTEAFSAETTRNSEEEEPCTEVVD